MLMTAVLLGALSEPNRLWYALPLLVSISLVYGATRHELPRPILDSAGRFAIWTLVFLALLMVFVTLLSR
jgi:hypothetical protein